MKKNIFHLMPDEKYLDLYIFQYGQEQCPPCYSFGPATRNHFLFHYILHGKGTLHSTGPDKKSYSWNLNAGQGFLIFPNMINTYVADEDDPWFYIWIEFDGIKASSLITSSGLTYENPIYESSNTELTAKMLGHLQEIVYKENTTSTEKTGNLYLFLDALTQSCNRYQAHSITNRKDFYVKQAISYIEQYYSRPDLSLEEIACFCNLNRNYLGRLFKEKLNRTPQQFLINYRMYNATSLLDNTDYPIGEIGKVVGYPNQMNFSRTFRQVYGVSPSEWRKGNKK